MIYISVISLCISVLVFVLLTDAVKQPYGCKYFLVKAFAYIFAADSPNKYFCQAPRALQSSDQAAIRNFYTWIPLKC